LRALRRLIFNYMGIFNLAAILIGPVFWIAAPYLGINRGRNEVFFLFLILVISSMASFFLKGDMIWGLGKVIVNTILREGDRVEFSSGLPDKLEQHTGKIIWVKDARQVDNMPDEKEDELVSTVFCMMDKQKLVRAQDENTLKYFTVPIFYIDKML